MGKLIRSQRRMFAGVCAGIADSFQWNVGKLRLVWAVMAVLTAGALVVFYLILWFLMPGAASRKKSYEERMNERLGRR